MPGSVQRDSQEWVVQEARRCSVVLRSGVHAEHTSCASDIIWASLLFQINQTWKTLPANVPVCTAKPEAKKLKNRKEQLHLHLTNFQSDKRQQGAGDISAQPPGESALPGYTPVSPDFTSRVSSKHLGWGSLHSKRCSWIEKWVSETVQHQECQEVSHGADCGLKRGSSVSCETELSHSSPTPGLLNPSPRKSFLATVS